FTKLRKKVVSAKAARPRGAGSAMCAPGVKPCEASGVRVVVVAMTAPDLREGVLGHTVSTCSGQGNPSRGSGEVDEQGVGVAAVVVTDVRRAVGPPWLAERGRSHDRLVAAGDVG